MPSTKEIMNDLASGMKPVEVAKKYDVSLPRISNAKREHELKTLRMEAEMYKRQIEDLSFIVERIRNFAKRKAINIKADRLTEDELQWILKL